VLIVSIIIFIIIIFNYYWNQLNTLGANVRALLHLLTREEYHYDALSRSGFIDHLSVSYVDAGNDSAHLRSRITLVYFGRMELYINLSSLNRSTARINLLRNKTIKRVIFLHLAYRTDLIIIKQQNCFYNNLIICFNNILIIIVIIVLFIYLFCLLSITIGIRIGTSETDVI